MCPDGALREDAVLVQRDSLPSAAGVKRSIRIVLDGRLPWNTRCGASQSEFLGLTSSSVFSELQSLGLREHIGQEQVVMPADPLSGWAKAMKSHGMSRVPGGS